MRCAIAVLVVSILAWAAGPAAAQAPSLEVAIALVGAASGDAYQGALQGLAEANKQGRFLGQSYTLTAYPDATSALAAQPAALVAALASAADLKALAEAGGGLPVFDVSLTDAASRALCLPQLFHIQPSEAMKAQALEQWRAAGGAGQATAVAWNADFRKYAALQLNKRYREGAGGAAMNDTAWAGWAAVKLYSDAVARKANTDPATIIKFLREDLAFDGQKGVEMTFRSNGQLRQVLLIEQAGKVVAEAPIAGVVDATDLDSLGGGDCPAE